MRGRSFARAAVAGFLALAITGTAPAEGEESGFPRWTQPFGLANRTNDLNILGAAWELPGTRSAPAVEPAAPPVLLGRSLYYAAAWANGAGGVVYRVPFREPAEEVVALDVTPRWLLTDGARLLVVHDFGVKSYLATTSGFVESWARAFPTFSDPPTPSACVEPALAFPEEPPSLARGVLHVLCSQTADDVQRLGSGRRVFLAAYATNLGSPQMTWAPDDAAVATTFGLPTALGIDLEASGIAVGEGVVVATARATRSAVDPGNLASEPVEDRYLLWALSEGELSPMWSANSSAASPSRLATGPPAISGGRVFAKLDDRVVAFNVERGLALWTHPIGHEDGFVRDTASAFGAHGDVLYVTSSQTLYALRATDGSEAWRSRVSGNAYFSRTGPLIVGSDVGAVVQSPANDTRDWARFMIFRGGDGTIDRNNIANVRVPTGEPPHAAFTPRGFVAVGTAGGVQYAEWRTPLPAATTGAIARPDTTWIAVASVVSLASAVGAIAWIRAARKRKANLGRLMTARANPSDESRFEPIRELGRGTFGRAVLARDRRLNRLVVVKEVATRAGRDAGYRERFEREAVLAARIEHPNVVRVYEALVDAEPYRIVMEYVRGGTLEERLAAASPLSRDELAQIALDVLHGLEAIHAARIVHRDVKPSNVLLTASGEAKVADFGIARALDETSSPRHGTRALPPSGTPPFVAPELLRGAPPTPACDVFAAGVTLRLAASRTELAPTEQARWNTILDRATDASPERRFASALEMRAAVLTIVQGT